MNSFKIGDRVVVKNNWFIRTPLGGTIVHIIEQIRPNNITITFYGVEFDVNIHDKYERGHNCEGHAKQGHGYYFEEKDLELENTTPEKPRIRWYSKGRFKDWKDE